MRGEGPLPLTNLVPFAEQAADGFARVTVSEENWIRLAESCGEGLHDLSALWFDGEAVRMALMDPGRKLRAIVALPVSGDSYPSVAQHHVPALRLERSLRDLYGIVPAGLPDPRGWLDHGVWPEPPPGRRSIPAQGTGYPFLKAEGEGLHQIPVGPVHAGIIEPGHFRFTASGETVVRLEERLGYVHRGMELACRGADLARAARLAGRISGDSTVAYAFAFALAVEAALDWRPPARAVLLRGIMAELERISHHVNDVGAICNDASVIAIQAACTQMREDVLQTAAHCFGHRLMMDRIVPGGVAADLPSDGVARISALLERIEAGLATVTRVYDNMPSLQDRTVTTGVVKTELVRQYATGGYVGRATGRDFDARTAFPYPPYAGRSLAVPTRTAGDVDARLWVRVEEVGHSIAFTRSLLAVLVPGPVSSPEPPLKAGEGAALVEAFRGDLFLWLRLDANGHIAAFHARDASWFQWPLLEAAIEGNIVADFPLCNKSFNCSYAGADG